MDKKLPSTSTITEIIKPSTSEPSTPKVIHATLVDTLFIRIESLFILVMFDHLPNECATYQTSCSDTDHGAHTHSMFLGRGSCLFVNHLLRRRVANGSSAAEETSILFRVIPRIRAVSLWGRSVIILLRWGRWLIS